MAGGKFVNNRFIIILLKFAWLLALYKIFWAVCNAPDQKPLKIILQEFF